MLRTRVYQERKLKFFQRLFIVWLVLAMLTSVMTMAVSAATTTLDQVVDMMMDAGLTDWPAWGDKGSSDEGTILGGITYYTERGEDGNLTHDPTDPDNVKGVEKLTLYTFLYQTFGTASKYNAFVKEFGVVAELDEETGTMKMQEIPGKDFNDRYNKMISNFNGRVGSAAVGGTADKLFGTGNFDPDNNFLTPAMGWVYYIVNTMFSVLSQLVIWLFLLQLGADCLYIAVDFARAVFVPFDKNLGGGGGGAGSDDKGFKVRIISKEAYESVYGGTTSGTGDSMKSKNKVLVYLSHRIPTITIVAVYLVMVFGGWWPLFIGVVSDIVIKVFTYVLQFFGFSA